MGILKGAEINRFIASPPDDGLVVLVFGPDTGLVSERTATLAANASKGDDDPFSFVKLDGSEISSDPARLIDEVQTVPMFGGRRIVWIKNAGGRDVESALVPVLELDEIPALVILEAGDLKKGTGLRKRAEGHRKAQAIACYADTGRDIEQLIDEETRAAGLTITREARAALSGLLGGDRIASRGELKKLCLYAHGKGRIETDDIEAIIGDASSFETSQLIDATATGDLGTLDHGLERLVNAGEKATIIANQALRHFQQLHRMRADLDSGKHVKAIVDTQRPPIFFSRKQSFTLQLQIWKSQDLERAMPILADATRLSRLNDKLGMPVLSEALLTLARVARSRRNRR